MIDADPTIRTAGLELFANEIDPDTIQLGSDPAFLPQRGRSRSSESARDRLFAFTVRATIDGMARVCLYRKRTINLLRRYAKLSVETGEVPSVLSGMDFAENYFLSSADVLRIGYFCIRC